MRERPILFSAPMVRAILDGCKTQTRRAVKPVKFCPEWGSAVGQKGGAWIYGSPAALGLRGRGDHWMVPLRGDVLQRMCTEEAYGWGAGAGCRYGIPGDRLWVKETFSLETCVEPDQELPHKDGRPVRWKADAEDPDDPAPLWIQPHYRATDPPPDLCCESERCRQCRDHDMGPHWKPSIHMPRWASRITLELTGVRVERVQSISYADIVAEGVTVPVDADTGNALIDISTKNGPGAFLTREQFKDPEAIVRAHWAAVWCEVNGRESWDANPWVWALTFKRVEMAA